MYYSKQYMNQAKRQLSVDMSREDNTKKLRSKLSVSDENKFLTCMEDLSNELIYEIFEYLDDNEIFNIFSNLNQRFENLVIHSNLPLKIRCSTSSKQSFEVMCLQMIIPNKHRILSFHLSNRSELMTFFTLHTIDSSFHRLESLVLHGIQSNEIISFLPCLRTLPRLFSLNISLDDDMNDPNEIYRLIFRLPMLKYNKLSQPGYVIQDFLSMTPTEQCSSVEQLVIDYLCRHQGLYNICSHTPKLRRLTCAYLSQSYQHFHSEIPLRLFHLTHCWIQSCSLKFDEFEIFIQKISSPLRVLNLTPPRDIDYLDANRWEQLISQYMPYLHTFQFEYTDPTFGSFQIQYYHSFINRFTSSFWSGKGWTLDIQTDLNHGLPKCITYSIQPHKKRWYDLLNYKNNSAQFTEQESMNVLKPTSQLTIQNCHFEQYDRWFIEYMHFISSLARITSLHIELNYFSIDILIALLYQLPNLDSLTIVFMISNRINELIEEQMSMFHATSNMNKITKVCIEQMVDLDCVDIFINVCPQIEYLQVQCRNYTDLESMIRLILIKRKSRLSSLCFCISTADDLMVKTLQTKISFEKLLVNYTIHRLHDRIYLQWQRD